MDSQANQSLLAEEFPTPSQPHVCFIIPLTLLRDIINNSNTSEATRTAIQNTYNHCCHLQQKRKVRHAELDAPAAHSLASGGQSHHSIIPPYVFQDIANSEEATSEQTAHAKANIKISQDIHAARADRGSGLANAAAVIHREIYDSKRGKRLRNALVLEDGGNSVQASSDVSAKEVFDSFGKTYQFYQEVFKRSSVDNRNMKLIGSVHYDDIPGPPGMDNAFWDGDEMAFGDGDGEIFGSFTKNLDVIGHELTHGVVQHTANLAYENQSGALNESMADVFGSMIKQYFHPGGPQTADAADWLIGEGIFLPSIANAAALRSMKAPGTAYNNPKVGRDRQPVDMDGYVDASNDEDGDWGGVHINSGIPNHAFYLAAIALGGHSWDKAGKIWYAALRDKKLRGIDTQEAFKIFADLTVKYASNLFDADAETAVKEAWTTVKVLTTVEQPREDL